jgi:hypothetical protein
MLFVSYIYEKIYLAFYGCPLNSDREAMGPAHLAF